MGSTYASGLNEMAINDVMLKNVILAHLRTNCYPPYPSAFLGMAFDAVKAGRADEWDTEISMPEGYEHTRYGSTLTASQLVEWLRLDWFIEISEGWDDKSDE